MQVIYANQPFPTEVTKVLFLLGPTPRDAETPSWRITEALPILEELEFDGTVLVPEDEDGKWRHSYDDQIEWEEAGLNRADVIAAWMPRKLPNMPAFTSNVEFSRWEDSGKMVFGAPEDAEKVRYLQYYCTKLGIPQHTTLRDTLIAAVAMLGKGAHRKGGECEVPLNVWQTLSFQNWYRNLKFAGNRLEHARVEYPFRIGTDRSILFLWILRVDIYVAAEARNKTNEFVIARPDISTVVAYLPGRTLLDSTVAMVREFRSAVANPQGFVRELPGGSSFSPNDLPKGVAAHEYLQETGHLIPPERLQMHEGRQLIATLSAHRADVFSVEITAAEVLFLRKMAGTTHGVEEDSERTYVEVKTVRELLEPDSGVDWSMLGMILSVLVRKFGTP
jgi:hypothetical protein